MYEGAHVDEHCCTLQMGRDAEKTFLRDLFEQSSITIVLCMPFQLR